MKSYPVGVVLNTMAPGYPPKYSPVPEADWRMFAPLKEAEEGLEEIEAIALQAVMYDENSGMYSQFVYLLQPPDIRVRVAYGLAIPTDGGKPVKFTEYPSDILDRYSDPLAMIDTNVPGSGFLKCRRVAADPSLGELYWE